MNNYIVPCVGAVILDEKGRVLLVKHVPEKGGFWAEKYICPGGRLEYGEPMEQGLRREILEETGLEIKILRWLPPMERIIRNHNGIVVDHVIYLDVLAQVAKGKFRPASDIGEGEWFPSESLEELLPQIHEDTIGLLQEVDLLPKHLLF